MSHRAIRITCIRTLRTGGPKDLFGMIVRSMQRSPGYPKILIPGYYQNLKKSKFSFLWIPSTILTAYFSSKWPFQQPSFTRRIRSCILKRFDFIAPKRPATSKDSKDCLTVVAEAGPQCGRSRHRCHIQWLGGTARLHAQSSELQTFLPLLWDLKGDVLAAKGRLNLEPQNFEHLLVCVHFDV